MKTEREKKGPLPGETVRVKFFAVPCSLIHILLSTCHIQAPFKVLEYGCERDRESLLSWGCVHGAYIPAGVAVRKTTNIREITQCARRGRMLWREDSRAGASAQGSG